MVFFSSVPDEAPKALEHRAQGPGCGRLQRTLLHHTATFHLRSGNTSVEQKVPLKGLKDRPKRALINYYDDVLASPN